MTHFKLRELFMKYCLSHDHKEIPPIPLVPKDDPTTLFTGSGMQQLVPYLLGEPHPLGKKLYNIQPCFRSQDIEEIGDNRHTTFFEMMGNWSLGTYFKKEQITWFWEFLTDILKLPKEKLYVAVFAGIKNIGADEETYETWKKLGLKENHIFRYGPESWWSRAGVPENMPPGEPGGPDSEVFYEFTQVEHNPTYGEKCHPNCDCGRFLEIGNSVFMQFKKNTDGSFSELPEKNVDFGGGLERILAAVNNDPDIFKTDLYATIITSIEQSSSKKYTDLENKSQIRVIADHIKASVFIIKNGVYPSNKEQGYFLRRLLRRAAVKMHKLTGKLNAKELGLIADQGVLVTYDKVHFDREQDKKLITNVIVEEINRFSKSIDRGLKEIQKIQTIDGKQAFDIYQSYGFPLEITEELFREKGQTVDKKQFYAEFQKHKDLSRTASSGKFKGGLADNSAQTLNYHTATHLLHQALYDVLGSEIRQEGSNITGERLRFDFYSTQKPSPEQIAKAQDTINSKIQEALPVEFKILPKAEAEKLGAKSFFREKYPDMVKVYFIGNYSKEFCGGPHVKNTKEIGKITIFKNEKIGSNLYRIYAK
ncbi:hypothetical protein A2334_02515 [Candidatus Roizmanbacteria bacterium RIFOXYB2_FULL_38_10]|uniref:alanine--tRNA ligase n=1 Tax=Candidatus Roizmanbacteria bacterium RIFOXYD1_FULL_38_12 TaxID=1802093 RepID=A0A1F7L2G6_9BACT|nr:MAG: hypothetical protein A3K47_01455 [Candidatus Roizmanbacteria bacterium RIFOXYA2_FULL_38_14]OGK64332.1 MAG: hypothetical protein A3K27_01455 [Candidatus Roizmanbacteria bacterium RIFOXYA1_FULL_37_12]OGK66178.1 MAG: hypothetical protein A3K38_01455 [Candidatus Roizmanbacteria bacterium RIFOXYB1_FULL_40_23]OGK68016.1 MAG: hypothetical protein A2334_02515 [Candidatus Roizmanbacteria bacterium RIFOXYB2_FULL_38_10]OGK70583.1 MAG: hypothetical protein A3K21_01460 [Candidatus Roizmanbacteria ba